MIKVHGINTTVIEIELAHSELINRVIRGLKRATPVKTGRARDGWQRRKNTIINEVPYIGDLNRGSSVQAPPHFIEKELAKY